MQADILDALRRGANEDALSLARAATTANPQDPQAHRALAMALRASGDSDAALVSIDRAIALAPEDAEQIGRASCRERVCPYVYISVVAVSLKKKTRS